MGRREPRRGDPELSAARLEASAPIGGRGVPEAKQERHWAEELAERTLVDRGYELLRRNYRLRGGEVDLVLRAPGGTVVFVEVRQRRTVDYGGAAGSLSPAKQRRVRQAAAHFLATVMRETDVAVRFDAVLVLGEGRGARLTHLEDAF